MAIPYLDAVSLLRVDKLSPDANDELEKAENPPVLLPAAVIPLT